MEFADGYEGVTVAGILFVRLDGEPSVFLAQRAYDETDDEAVRETWEAPGGHLEPGEDPLAGALREFSEEVGLPVPEHEVVHGWRGGDDGHYQGFVAEARSFAATEDFQPNDEVQAVGWFTAEEASTLNLRPEFAANDLTALLEAAVSGNEETDMDDDTTEVEMAEEPDTIVGPLEPVLVHGILAPENLASGDGRGFNEGALTARPLRLPLGWQKFTAPGHDQAVTVGSIDRIMRKDGMIHWEGSLIDSDEADEFTALVAHFGRYGVSIDGDRGSADQKRSSADGMTWFDAARISGACAVSIPAFAEAYVSLGPHPDMPAEVEAEEAMVASGDLLGRRMHFKRGAGWVTNPKETSRIHAYWTQKGQPGYVKIAWGTPGDFRRCRVLVGEKIAKNSPEKMRYINQICAEWHNDALGYWPGELGKPGNAPDTPENRRRAARHAAAGETGEFSDDETPSLAEAHEESARVNAEAASSGWEPVLVSSAGARVCPPADYFTRHPDTGALVIDEPDANGIRRTYGYAGEWGVCHIGFDGRCVEVPADPTGSGYAEFHLGRTKVDGGDYINTGLITYKIDHRGAQQILTESAEQQHYDNINHAWAAVRLGEDERGVWFSGVVLPHVPEDDLVLIEAAGQVSGEWKYGALRSLLAVNVPGFAVHRSEAEFDSDGQVRSLVASVGAHVSDAPCEAEFVERMAALKAIDAEVRFSRLRDEWEGRLG